MLFDRPINFATALDIAAERGLLPTLLSSAEIRRQWSADVRRQSVFSARTNHAGYLEAVQRTVADLVAGRINQATARERLQILLDELGYTPAEGFPGKEPVPPAEEGGLQDISSTERQNLMLTTQTRQALNRGYQAQWASEAQRRAFPAWELVRIYPRRIPRGWEERKSGLVAKPGDDWPSRWAEAGGKFYGGRMIAPVDDPVWGELGSSTNFDDGLDNPYPPFAFNSGFGLHAVARREAIRLGVISEREIPGAPSGVTAAPAQPPLPKRHDPEILRALKRSLERDLEGREERRRRMLERAAGRAA